MEEYSEEEAEELMPEGYDDSVGERNYTNFALGVTEEAAGMVTFTGSYMLSRPGAAEKTVNAFPVYQEEVGYVFEAAAQNSEIAAFTITMGSIVLFLDGLRRVNNEILKPLR